MSSHIDYWDIKSNTKSTKYPKKVLSMRKEQQSYKYPDTDTILNKFRTLQNAPSNIITPETFCDNIKALYQDVKNTKITILTPKELKQQRLNLILSVDSLTSRMLIVEYKGKQNKKVDLGIVGKGVTFDSGGYSLKPPNSMIHMYLDKTGGVMALYLLHCLALKKVKKNITVCVPLVQNSVSHMATKPGDIITAYNKLKVEITNTDAEGRLIVADGLSYMVDKYKPKLLVNMGTFTGIDKCKISYAYFTLSKNICKLLEQSAKSYGEKLFKLQIEKEYLVYTWSVRGDIKNANYGCGDKLLVPLFLLNFIPESYYDRWLHLNLTDMTVSNVAILEGSYSILDFINKII